MNGILTYAPACRLSAVLLLGMALASPAEAQYGDLSPESNDGFGRALARGDFNNDGYQDLAIGIPYEDIRTGIPGPLSPQIVDAGAVEVIYGSATGLTGSGRQFWRQGSNGLGDTPETGDHFGASLAAADFNGDHFADLAIGVPLEDTGLVGDAGAVQVLYGSPQGLFAPAAMLQFWHQNSYSVKDLAEASDWFGESLAAGDFNRDGFGDLAIGVTYEDVGTVRDAGMVHVLYGAASGLTAVSPDDQIWTQDSPGVDDTAEADDTFGSSLAAGDFNGDGFSDLAIGVRWENVGVVTDPGAVNVIYGLGSGLSAGFIPDQFLYQQVGIPDGAQTNDEFGYAVAAGDFNGDGFDDLAIGVRGEDVRGIGNAGAVNVVYGSADRLTWTAIAPQFWNQDSYGVEGGVEPDDGFGSPLTVGDFNNDGCDDLAIGVPYEAIGNLVWAGAVNVIYGSYGAGLSPFIVPDQLWHQSTAGMPTSAAAGDTFGWALIAGDFNGDGWADLVVGVPGDDVNSTPNAGAVNVIHGAPGGLNAFYVPVRTWSQQYIGPPQP